MSIGDASKSGQAAHGRRALRRALPLALVGGAMLVAAGLRGMDIGRWEIWLDEACSYLTASSPEGLIAELRTDNHPIGYFALLKAWMAVAGDSAVALRLPSLVASVAAVGAVAALARRLGESWRATVWAAGLMAVLPLQVYYAVEARSYSLLTLMVVLMLWSFVGAAKTGRGRDWALHAAIVAMASYVHYLALVVAGGLWIAAALARVPRRTWGGLAAAHTGAAIAFVPGMMLMLQQMGASGGSDWIASAWRTLGPMNAIPRSIEVLGVGGAMPDGVSTPSLPGAWRWVGVGVTVAGLVAAAWPWRVAGGSSTKEHDGDSSDRGWWGLNRFAWVVPVSVVWPLVFLVAYSLACKPLYVLARYDLVAQPGLVLLLAVGFAAVEARLWRRGRAWAGAWGGGLAALPALVVAGMCLSSYVTREPWPFDARHFPQTYRAEALRQEFRPGDRVICLGLEYATFVYAARRAGVRTPIETFPGDTAAHPGWMQATEKLRARWSELGPEAARLTDEVEPGERLWVVLDVAAQQPAGPAVRKESTALLARAAQERGWNIVGLPSVALVRLERPAMPR